MSLQSRTASGKQAMIQSANQAVGTSAPSAGWYLTRCDTGSTLNNASPTATITSGATAIALFTGDISYLLPDGDTPYHIKVFEPGDPSTFEVMRVTDVTGDTITVDRAREGTTAQTWTTSAHLRLRFDIDVAYKVALSAPTPATGVTVGQPRLLANRDGAALIAIQKTSSGPTYQAHVQLRDTSDGSLIWVQEYSTDYGIPFYAEIGESVCALVLSEKLLIIDATDGSILQDVDLYGELDAVLPADTSGLGEISIMSDIAIYDGFVYGVGARNGKTSSIASGQNAAYPEVWSVAIADGGFTSTGYAVSTADMGGTYTIAMQPQGGAHIGSGVFVYGVLGFSVFGADTYRWFRLSGGAADAIAAMDQYQRGDTRDQFDGTHFYASRYRATTSPSTTSILGKFSASTLALVDSETYSGDIRLEVRTSNNGSLVWGTSVHDSSLLPVFTPKSMALAGEDYTATIPNYSQSLDAETELLFISPNYAKLRNVIDDL